MVIRLFIFFLVCLSLSGCGSVPGGIIGGALIGEYVIQCSFHHHDMGCE